MNMKSEAPCNKKIDMFSLYAFKALNLDIEHLDLTNIYLQLASTREMHSVLFTIDYITRQSIIIDSKF